MKNIWVVVNFFLRKREQKEKEKGDLGENSPREQKGEEELLEEDNYLSLILRFKSFIFSFKSLSSNNFDILSILFSKRVKRSISS